MGESPVADITQSTRARQAVSRNRMLRTLQHAFSHRRWMIEPGAAQPPARRPGGRQE